ncbi:MAG: hypothetical protein HN855_03945 [Anaerolineae bacterium]|nr:hypothetical protein [Anaerolineae bacterium]MBT7324286.1 hypothetical protein [Anaerolineae bacterium]
MFNTVEEYLDALKQEMQGTDNATIQDALVDAEEHLRTALENDADTLAAIIEQYGTPEETAAAYAEVERRTAPALIGSVYVVKAFGQFLMETFRHSDWIIHLPFAGAAGDVKPAFVL